MCVCEGGGGLEIRHAATSCDTLFPFPTPNSLPSPQALNEMEVRQALMQHFCQLMSQADRQIYADHGTTEAEVKAATAANAADPSVKEYVDKIQKVFKVLSGDDGPPVEIPAHVTPEKILEMMEKICKRCVH